MADNVFVGLAREVGFRLNPRRAFRVDIAKSQLRPRRAEPLNEFVDSTSMGGIGSLLVAGIDCAGKWNTLKKLADGDRDPKTGQCRTISSAMELRAVPAFVNDIPANAKERIASR